MERGEKYKGKFSLKKGRKKGREIMWKRRKAGTREEGKEERRGSDVKEGGKGRKM